ncbi:MAG: hypothetical protein ACRDJV_04950 [Actinomycetota bacterium]
MTDQMTPVPGITRRETLKRGAALGGALLWSVPVIQTLGMTHAHAAVPSGPTPGPDVSYIAMNVTCNGLMGPKQYFIKFEAECPINGNIGCFEDDPGNTPGCVFTPTGEKKNGADLGFEVEGPHPVSRCYEVVVPASCIVNATVIKGGQRCCPGPMGTGDLVVCPPHCA